ncbi:hypothetical protein LCGC14_0980770 [marine sediment metagenome]|uniref:ParB-like N-terminal domain-containing protein n=1 Tax=marine sediment metagenome TaxID=412755 RepID=A0A0F9ND76_9ZZZZ
MKIKIEEIVVGERFRKKFEGVDELATSIKQYGLINPIVLDDSNNLIAGERRLKACILNKMEEVDVRRFGELTDLEKKEIELEENIQRRAFTWQEEVDAKAQLHRLKQKMFGAAVKGHTTNGTWKLKDTAAALGETPGQTSIDIQLSAGMKVFPELAKEKSKTVAYKKMKAKQNALLQEELAKRLKDKGIIDAPNIHLGSCLEHMANIKSESIDLIVTDPPYGINIGKSQTFGKSSPQATYSDGDFETFDLLDKAFAEMYRVLKQNTHMYMFFGIDKYQTVVDLLEKHGFEVHRLPIIWDKGSGSYPSQSTTFVHSYEPFLHISKGKRRLNGTPRDVYAVKRVPPNKKVHPTEKPTGLLRDLIELSSLPGETVLDPFAGSGATLVAAKEKNRKGIGIELDPKFHKAIVDRIGGDSDE